MNTDENITDENNINFIVNELSNFKAENINVIDVTKNSSIANYLIFATATSTTHAKACGDNLCKKMADKMNILGKDGYREGEWIIIDFCTIIVHIMLEDTRNFYNLEEFWKYYQKNNDD